MTTKKKIRNDSGLDIKWALLCKSASVDQQTNSISLFNIIEELTIEKGPLGSSVVKKLSTYKEKTHIKTDFTLVVQIEKGLDAETQKFNPEMKIEVTSPTGDGLAMVVIPLKFEGEKNRLRAIVSMDTFPVEGSGLYKIIISTRVSTEDNFEEGTAVPVEVKIYE